MKGGAHGRGGGEAAAHGKGGGGSRGGGGGGGAAAAHPGGVVARNVADYVALTLALVCFTLLHKCFTITSKTNHFYWSNRAVTCVDRNTFESVSIDTR